MMQCWYTCCQCCHCHMLHTTFMHSSLCIGKQGQRAYHLTLNNSSEYNEKVEFPNVLAGVRMTVHSEHDCWLLDPKDYDYTEAQMQRFSKYHNGTATERKKQGEWPPWGKDVRKNHDQQKPKALRVFLSVCSCYGCTKFAISHKGLVAAMQLCHFYAGMHCAQVAWLQHTSSALCHYCNSMC